MYLVDTNVVSEARKGPRANPGVRRFFDQAAGPDWPLYLSAVTIGELRRGVELIRHRGDLAKAGVTKAGVLTLAFAINCRGKRQDPRLS